MTADNHPKLPSNLAVLRGVVARQPVERRLPAGSRVLQFDIATLGSASAHLAGRAARRDDHARRG